MRVTSLGLTNEYGIAINYNPDYNDVSFQFWKWYFAIGRSQKPKMLEPEDIGLDLPVYVADDDFFEYLIEEGFDESLDVIEVLEAFDEWMKENCE
jgi:hypothetical protein